VLQRRATPAGAVLETHHLVAVLLALRDCLSGAAVGLPVRWVLWGCPSGEAEGTLPAGR